MKYSSIILAILLTCSTYGQTTVRICENPSFKFTIPAREINCMRHFRPDMSEANSINEFFLAKFSELVYLERIDYQIRYMKNGARPVTSIPSTDWIKRNGAINNENIACAFAARFAHFFYNESDRPKRYTNFEKPNTAAINQIAENNSISRNLENRNVNVGGNNTANTTNPTQNKPAPEPRDFEKDSLDWVRENIPTFKFVGQTLSAGLVFLPDIVSWDPEVMLINSKYGIFIIFRGTDAVANRNGDLGEWFGTDFFIAKSGIAGAPGQVHAGFVANYNLVQAQIKQFLNTYAAPGKKIWVAGHSLGGALAILSAVMLKGEGFPVQGVYSFGGPRVIGDRNFVTHANRILPNIQRFEYYLDPITVAGLPSFEHNLGKRNWYDHADYGRFEYYSNVEERRLGDPLKNPPFGEFGYNPGVMGLGADSPARLDQQRKLKARLDANMLNFLPPFTNIEITTPSGSKYSQMDRMFFGYHNPPYYLKAAYSRVSKNYSGILGQLPLIDDSWPYAYYDMPGAK